MSDYDSEAQQARIAQPISQVWAECGWTEEDQAGRESTGTASAGWQALAHEQEMQQEAVANQQEQQEQQEEQTVTAQPKIQAKGVVQAITSQTAVIEELVRTIN